MDEAAASLRTVMDSTSSGLTYKILGISTLSNNIKGELLPVIDATAPRILITGSEPTSPLGMVTFSPGVVPWMARPTSATVRPSRFSLIVTVDTAPVTLPLLWVPYPTTTTSSNDVPTSSTVIFRLEEVTTTSLVA